MQTFLPDPSYAKSAAYLDYKRLGKQRVEVKQLLLALGYDVGPHKAKTNSSWANHPACKMWKGYERALTFYGTRICNEWVNRGYNDTLFVQFEDVLYDKMGNLTPVDPPWLGNEAFHRSHQSNLIRKDWDYYSRFWPGVPDNLEYVWP